MEAEERDFCRSLPLPVDVQYNNRPHIDSLPAGIL